MDNFIRGSLYETVQHLASGPGVRRPVELSSAKAFVAHQLNDHRLEKLRKLFKGIEKDNKKGMHFFIYEKVIYFFYLYIAHLVKEQLEPEDYKKLLTKKFAAKLPC